MLLSADNCADIPSLSPRLLPETRRSGGRWLRRSAGEGPGGRAGQEGQPGKHTGSRSSRPRVRVAGGLGNAEAPWGGGGSALEGRGWTLSCPEKGESQAQGVWAGGAGFSLVPPPRGQHAGCLPPGPRAPPGGQAYWHLTTVLTLPLPAPSQRPGPGPPGRTPVIRGSPQPRPSPRPQMVWDTLTPERRPRTWVSAEVRTPCGCYISFRSSGALWSSP